MMKRILKLFAVLWLIVGCSAGQSTTQKLAGEYVYDDDGDEYTIIIESPDGKDNTSGNASYKDDDDDAYYGTYKVYEGTETIVIDLDDGSLSGETVKFNYDLDNGTLTAITSSDNGYVFKKK